MASLRQSGEFLGQVTDIWPVTRKSARRHGVLMFICLLVLGVTDCQMNEAGLQCDQDGQYQASQRDRGSGKTFCVDIEGQMLPGSETEAPLSDSQCLSMYCWFNQSSI